MLGLEESRLELESVWSSVNLLNIVTDKLEMDRFAQVNELCQPPQHCHRQAGDGQVCSGK
jgi:hypothetical protein